ncbi:hypothetical protein PO124_24560 [Bacillus licheniformis]|nr:hypothetical protein [Bacillus licheniformis]
MGERQEIVISSLDQEADVYFNETDSFFGEKVRSLSSASTGNGMSCRMTRNLFERRRSVRPCLRANGDEIAFGLNILRIVEDDLLEIEGFGKFDTSLENILKPSSETKINIRNTAGRRE